MIELNPISVESSELVEQTFNFWFNDQEHIRSPFPNYIHNELRRKATENFFKWASGLNNKAKDEINDEIIGERFEEIIFETAMDLVMTEDEKTTIKYPFLPRVGDMIFENAENQTGKSIVLSRSMQKEGDQSFMSIKLEKNDSGEQWSTTFELPE